MPLKLHRIDEKEPREGQARGRGGFWDFSKTMRAGNSRRYSLFVKALRFVLPLLALSVITLLFAWPHLMEEDDIVLRPEQEAVAPIVRNELLNPVYEGLDSENRPFRVTASRAVQSSQNADIVILDDPDAALTFGGQANGLAAAALEGRYNQDTQALFLQDNVRLTYLGETEMRSARFFFNMTSGVISTDAPVEADGPDGTLKGSGLRYDHETQHLLVTGPATVTLNQVGGGNAGMAALALPGGGL